MKQSSALGKLWQRFFSKIEGEWLKYQTWTAIRQADKTTKRTRSVLVMTSASGATSVIEKMEQKVAKREEEALASAAEILARFANAEIETLDESALERLLQELADAYIQFEQVTRQFSASDRQLEQQRDKNLQQEQTWEERAKEAESQDNPELAKMARQRGLHYTEAALQLSECLAKYKQQSETAVQQTLADLRAISERIRLRQQQLKDAVPRSVSLSKEDERNI